MCVNARRCGSNRRNVRALNTLGMKVFRVLSRLLVAQMVTSCGYLSSVGSVEIVGLDVPIDTESCGFSSDPNAPSRLAAKLDVFRRTLEERDSGIPISVPIEYVAAARINVEHNRNSIQFREALVTLRNSVTGALVNFRGLPNPFLISVLGTVPAGSAAATRSTVVLVPAIPEQYGAQLESFGSGGANVRTSERGATRTLLVSISLAGVTGGQAITTATFAFPLQLCDRCLIACDRRPSPTTDFVPISSCFLGQDVPYAYRQSEICP